MFKGFLSQPRVVAALGHVAAGYIRFVYRSTRWERSGWERLGEARIDGKPAIYAFWHGRIALSAAGWKDQDLPPPPPISVLISNNRDGEVITAAMTPFGIDVVRGSGANPKKKGKQKGGATALLGLLRLLKRGPSWVAVTPDGPRGPRMRAADGVAALAAATGAVVFPSAWSTTNAKVFNSWDRFMLPFPFGAGAHVVGPPLAFDGDPHDEDAVERFRLEVEQGLVDATQTADRMVGRTPVEPAAPLPRQSPAQDAPATRPITEPA